MENKKVEFMARFPKKKELSEEDVAYESAKKLINPEYETPNTSLIEYEYDYIITDLKDIADIVRYDEEHTQIIKYSGVLYILKIDYESFKDIYSSTLGSLIYTSIT